MEVGIATNASYVQLLHQNGSHLCGGTILASYLVITAAHCFDRVYYRKVRVVAGQRVIHRIFQMDDDAQILGIDEAIIHNLYDPKYHTNDIALLVLNSTFNFRWNIGSILFSPPWIPWKPSDSFTVFGWKNSTPSETFTKTATLANNLRYTVCRKKRYDDKCLDSVSRAVQTQGDWKPDFGGPILCALEFDQQKRFFSGIVSVGHRGEEYGGNQSSPGVHFDFDLNRYYHWIAEKSCFYRWNSSCPDQYYRCFNNFCVPQNYRCDRFEDCSDGSDEWNCQSIEATPGETLTGLACRIKDHKDNTEWEVTKSAVEAHIWDNNVDHIIDFSSAEWLEFVRQLLLNRIRKSLYTGAIAFGRYADPGEIPFQVQLRYKNGVHLCGGTIISTNLVLTAAHCFDNSNFRDVQVVARRLHLREYDANNQITDIHKVIIHESYDAEIYDNDIAILVLKHSLVFGDGVSSARLPTANTYLKDSAIVSGWGNVPELRMATAETLRLATVDIFNATVCREKWGEGYFDPDFDTGRLCALGQVDAGVKDACRGDSGGPLMCYQENDETKKYICGIVSAGENKRKCGDNSSLPGLYVKVSSYHGWIMDRTCLYRELYDCPPGYFRCCNNLCIEGSPCDSENDCGDNSDEKYCTEWSNNDPGGRKCRIPEMCFLKEKFILRLEFGVKTPVDVAGFGSIEDIQDCPVFGPSQETNMETKEILEPEENTRSLDIQDLLQGTGVGNSTWHTNLPSVLTYSSGGTFFNLSVRAG